MNQNVKDLLGNVLDAVQPVRDSLAKIDQEIEEREAELKELRTARQQAKKVLDILDPQAPKRQRRENGSGDHSRVSDAQVERILRGLPDKGQIFNSQQASELLGLHVTTIHKALKVLHERGQVRIDHMGGPRNTSKFYALTKESDG